MPSIIHSNDTYVAFEMVPEGTWGVDPGAGYKRVPFIAETFKLERVAIEPSGEIAPIGATRGLSYGPATVRGTLQTFLYYNALWEHWLLCQAHGGMEEIAIDCYTTTGVADTGRGINTHLYCPQGFKETTAGSKAGIPAGLTCRAWKMAQTNALGAGNKGIEVFTGNIPTEIEWVQELNQAVKQTVTMLGKGATLIDGNALTPTAFDATQYLVQPGDINRDNATGFPPSIFAVGSNQFDVDTWRLKVTANLRFPQAFATDPDNIVRPGRSGPWRCEGEFTARVRDDFFASGNPSRHLVDGTQDIPITIRYISAPGIAALNNPYYPQIGTALDRPMVFSWLVKKAIIRSHTPSIAGPGVLNCRFTFEGYEASYTSADCSTPTGRVLHANHVIQVTVDDGPLPGGDNEQKFNTSAQGGNNLHASLVTAT